MTYRIICAWCRKNLGTKEGPESTNEIKDPITHTICAECFEKALDGVLTDSAGTTKANE